MPETKSIDTETRLFNSRLTPGDYGSRTDFLKVDMNALYENDPVTSIRRAPCPGGARASCVALVNDDYGDGNWPDEQEKDYYDDY